MKFKEIDKEWWLFAVYWAAIYILAVVSGVISGYLIFWIVKYL